MSWETPVAELDRILDVNIKGMMYGCKVAMNGMIKQGFGTIYNMARNIDIKIIFRYFLKKEGMGSNGRIAESLIIYGSTKSALTYFTRGLQL